MTPEEAHAAAVEEAAGSVVGCSDKAPDAIIAGTVVTAYLASMARAGFVMVPVKATMEMLDDGRRAYRAARVPAISGMTLDAQTSAECAREAACYRAMVAARPKVGE